MSQIIIDPNYEPRWIENLDPEFYHADKTAVNSSSLKAILRSGFSFKSTFIDGQKKEPTPAMNFGTLAHMAILEGQKFREKYVVMPVFEGYTQKGELTTSLNCKDVKDKRDAWLTEMEFEGRVIVTQEELDKLMRMIDSFMANSDAVKLLSEGVTEISGYYPDPETGIVCRIRPDFLSFNLNAQVDVKTVASCDIDWFRRKRVEDDEFMYPFQMSMYEEGASIISKKKIDHAVWVLIENEPPHECVVVPMEEVYREIGGNQYRTALRKLKKCLTENTWPRRPNIQMMHPSDWYLRKQEILNG